MSCPRVEATDMTALTVAVGMGSEEAVDVLLKHGADPGQKDGRGQTAFEQASHSNHDDILKILLGQDRKWWQLGKGQKPQDMVPDDDRSLWYAVENGNLDSTQATPPPLKPPTAEPLSSPSRSLIEVANPARENRDPSHTHTDAGHHTPVDARAHTRDRTSTARRPCRRP